MKKRIVTAVICIALIFCFSVSFAAEDFPTPWEQEDMNIYVLEDFNGISDREVTKQELTWEGQENFPYSAKFEGGKFVFCSSEGTSADFRYMFSDQDAFGVELFQGIEGLGFYIENNTETIQSLGLFMIGNGLFLLDQGSTVILYDTQGKYTLLEGDNYVDIPAGFKGYFVVPLEFVINEWNGNTGWDAANDRITSFGLRFTSVAVDAAKNETLVFDDLFIYGAGVGDKKGDVNVIMNAGPAQTPPPSEEATPAPTDETTENPAQTTSKADRTNAPNATSDVSATNPQVSGTAENAPEGYVPAWTLWLTVGIAAVGIIIVLVICTVKIKKNQG